MKKILPPESSQIWSHRGASCEAAAAAAPRAAGSWAGARPGPPWQGPPWQRPVCCRRPRRPARRWALPGSSPSVGTSRSTAPRWIALEQHHTENRKETVTPVPSDNYRTRLHLISIWAPYKVLFERIITEMTLGGMFFWKWQLLIC